jgi:ATP-binding cassette subfamily G (WHITE) protein 2 (PDR)
MLFQRFDRLLLLAKGGRTVYFGDIGRESHVLINYFQRNGGPKYDSSMNPAEYMLDAIGATPGSNHTDIDWPTVWKSSVEYSGIHTELAKLRELRNEPSAVMDTNDSSYKEFAASFTTQFLVVGNRCAQQYWRTPSYIYSKALLSIGCVSNRLYCNHSLLLTYLLLVLVHRILVLQDGKFHPGTPESGM